MRELAMRQIDGQRAAIEAEAAKRNEAQYRERQFTQKVDRFVRAWGEFVRAYDKRAFDYKVARKVSKAFHEIESSGYWPTPDRK